MSPRRQSPYVVGIEEALGELRAGRMIILMDDEDRENEGDLCVAAARVTAEHINFMATHGRGLICLSLTERRCDQLGLPMMVSENRAPLGTAFTVSIDARHGIGRGISAVDRATTIRTAIRPDASPADIVSPGHVFPLRARRGGVLVRAGQTEGAVDLARLAGFAPAGVICEILRDDGTMARLPDLEEFAARHGLKIATIADLIEYRSRHDSLVHRTAEARITTRYGGDFRALVYTTDVDEGEHLVLAKGDIRADEPTLVRTHLEYLPGDVFGYRERDTRSLLQKAMERIAAEGKGVILYLRRDGRGLDLFSEPRADSARAPSTALGASWLTNFREFGIGAQILRDVGVGKIRWLTNRPLRLVSLPGYGLEIVDSVPLTLDDPGLSSATPRVPRLLKVR
jgi:3,4-dihydroxy 2-butanone 4-phosphate synthase/GTP cyclohydrolase II